MKSRVKAKNSQDPSMSIRNNHSKRKEDVVHRPSRAPDPQVSSLSDQEPPTNDDPSSCYDHPGRTHIPEATEGCRDTMKNPPQIYPPSVNEPQFPTVSGWPIWYNPTFPAPPQWLISNSAPKVSTDKGTQVEDTGEDKITGTNPERLSVVDTLKSKKVDDDSKNKIISVAVQTVNYEESETSAKEELDHGKLSLKDRVNARYLFTIFLLVITEYEEVDSTRISSTSENCLFLYNKQRSQTKLHFSLGNYILTFCN